jgi:hypothetical protein
LSVSSPAVQVTDLTSSVLDDDQARSRSDARPWAQIGVTYPLRAGLPVWFGSIVQSRQSELKGHSKQLE